MFIITIIPPPFPTCSYLSFPITLLSNPPISSFPVPPSSPLSPLPSPSPSLSLSLSLSLSSYVQYDCYTASCNYDGGDNCTLNPNSTSPWSNCKSAVFCTQAFGDGNCDVQCNSAKCFYDGGDCLPTCSNQDNCVKMINDGRCSPECNTQECPFDYVDCSNSPEYVRL